MTSERLRALDKQHLWHPFTHMKQWLDSEPLVIVAAEGMELIDSEGNRYLDGVSSLWCNVHGHRVAEIDRAVIGQLGRVAHSTMLGLSNEPAILLAEKLLKIAPPKLKKVFYSDAGATATEIAFKMAVQYWYNRGRPEKTEFVGFSEAYHGDTTGAMSVGRTAAFHRPYFPLLFKVHYAPTPAARGWAEATKRRSDEATKGQERHEGIDGQRHKTAMEAVREQSLRALEAILREHGGRIAGVCIEPVVQGAAGMLIQPAGFLRGVRELCDRYDVLLICDEVATGFGRTGRMFACEHEDVRPDLMCLAKGISGGYLPLAATLATQEIFDTFLGEPWEGRTFFHGHTYTGNPLACAAAIASLELFEKNDLVRRVAEKSVALAKMLDELRGLPRVGEVRQKGFMVGIELKRPADEATQRRTGLGAEICARVRRHGVILRPLGDVIILMPPLAMEVGDLRRIVDALRAEVSGLGTAQPASP